MKNRRCFFLFKCILIICVTLMSGCDIKDGAVENTNANIEASHDYDEDIESADSKDVGIVEETEKSVEAPIEADDVIQDEIYNIKEGEVMSNEVVSKLAVNGTSLVNEVGEQIQLRGISTHGITVYPEYVNYESFKTLRDDWGANCIRLAMYTMEENGYCNEANKEELKQLIHDGVSYATQLNMYVIIDWHILSDGNPRINEGEAIKFFEEMSAKYKNCPNVIYEICNEPNNTSWEDTKAYALNVIPVIKANNEDAVIIVGTPSWCQEPGVGVENPIEGYTNLMYCVHFYSASHGEEYRQRMIDAMDAGVPVFCSEFGTCSADGNGTYDLAEAEEWIKAMDERKISYCVWNLSNKAEASALIKDSCSKTSDWTVDELSTEGVWYRELLRKAINK